MNNNAIQVAIDNASSTYEQELKCVDLAELLKHSFPPKEFLLEPIIQRQGLAMIYAARGIGKTHVALNLAYAVASGGSLFDWHAPQGNRVLYIDGEMPGLSMQERLAAIVAASDSESKPENLQILTNDLQEFGLPDLGTVDGQRKIKRYTDDADLIILDNISTLCRAGAENKSDDWMVVQQWALKMRSQGRSVVFIHHAGKGGAQRGTSKREDILDTVINLRHPQDYEPSQGARFEVHFEKSRGITGDAVKPFLAELQTQDGTYQWITASLEENTYKRVMQLSREGLKQADIARELEINRSNVSRHIKRAKSEGVI